MMDQRKIHYTVFGRIKIILYKDEDTSGVKKVVKIIIELDEIENRQTVRYFFQFVIIY